MELWPTREKKEGAQNKREDGILAGGPQLEGAYDADTEVNSNLAGQSLSLADA